MSFSWQSYTVLTCFRHVALLQIQGKEFKMTPLPLRTVRPFVIEEFSLAEAGEEQGIDLNNPMEITQFLKSKVRFVARHVYLSW